MSQKMTDEEFSARAPWCHRGAADRHTQDRIAKEAKRARSEEARLLEENRKQADAIKALADVLESERGMHHSAHDSRVAVAYCNVGRCRVINAALRLAGRL